MMSLSYSTIITNTYMYSRVVLWNNEAIYSQIKIGYCAKLCSRCYPYMCDFTDSWLYVCEVSNSVPVTSRSVISVIKSEATTTVVCSQTIEDFNLELKF